MQAHRVSDILALIALSKQNKVPLTIVGATQGYAVADALAEAGVIVVVQPSNNLPGSLDRLGARLDNAALLHAYAKVSTFYGIPIADDPDTFLADLLANCGAFEAAVREFCEHDGLTFWSATPALTAASHSGEALFYRTDTHWRAEGQRILVPGLIEQLKQLGVKKQ